ncbi:MAG: hypothetical protein OXN81_07355 [Alphaproteobacteria bacterium]|nr:hypothetical protein [Alphaproteobacteria bacterium]
MFYRVYISPACRADAERHAQSREIKSFAEKLERDQSTRQLTRFTPPYLKKSFGKPGRLLIEEVQLQEDTVLCFSRYLIRADREYDNFRDNPEQFRRQNPIDLEDVRQTLAKTETDTPAPPKPSAAEASCLHSLSLFNFNEVALLESSDWVERMAEPWTGDLRLRYWEVVYQIVEQDNLAEGADVVANPNNPGIRVLYSWLPELRRILLVAPLRPRDPEDEPVLRESYATFLAPGVRLTHEDVGRVCRRSYPSFAVYDEEVWMRIQANEDANLALSPEEGSVLESVMTPGQDDARYPLFINGRPGSGKSTVLQYLFSEYLIHAIENGEAGSRDTPPLYLTYSDALLDRAKTVCRSILCCGAKQAAKTACTSDENRIDTLLDVAFRNMKDYLLERLPSEERRRYSRDSYVTFARFRREWNRARGQLPQPDVRRIDPDLAWHAIRTYIKGMTLETDGPMDPEYYEQELARDRRTLSGDTFRLIHKYVWKGWYLSRCQQDGWWDDQDLALAVLQSAAPLARHSAVFCDESQDFTNLELELIERLSLFSQRQLEPHQLRDVPYAFAGDPFQTLNPTGFDWGATQASFHDNIVRQLDPHGRGKLRFNFQELSFNYRSSEHIVRLTNLVQLLRARMFGLKSILPQHTWSRRESISPFYYEFESAQARASLRDQEDLVLIVPCQEGDEEEYVKKDSFLCEFAITGDGVMSRNVLSPARAKGLEYDRVLLYRFGDRALAEHSDFVAKVEALDGPLPDHDERLVPEYFVNQLYVAASRARKRLFILDSNEALARFWSFTQPEARRRLLECAGERWHDGDLCGLVAGDVSNWDADRDDPVDLAGRFEQQGREHRDHYLMGLAANNYARAGQTERAALCRAAALEYDGRGVEAGNQYADLGQPEDAARCFWSERALEKLRALAASVPRMKGDLRCEAALIVVTPGAVNELPALLGRVAEQIEPGKSALDEIQSWEAWLEGLLTLERRQAISAAEPTLRAEVVQASLSAAAALEIPESRLQYLGPVLSSAGEYRRALELWEANKDRRGVEPNWVVEARANTAPYPQNLKYWDRLGDDKGIVSAVRTGDSAPPRESCERILKAALKLRDWEVASQAAAAAGDLTIVQRAMREVVLAGGHEETVSALGEALVARLAEDGRWPALIALVDSGETGDAKLNGALASAGVQWVENRLRAAIIRHVGAQARKRAAGGRGFNMALKFVKRHTVLNRNQSNRQIVRRVLDLAGPEWAACAVEGGDHIVDSLEFYEQWTRGAFPDSDERRKWAREGWLRAKLRQARLGTAKSASATSENRYWQEADKAARNWQMRLPPVTDSAESPPVTLKGLTPLLTFGKRAGHVDEAHDAVRPPETGSSLPEARHRIELEWDNMRLEAEIFRRKRRVQLLNPSTQDQVLVDLQSMEVTSQDLDVTDYPSVGDERMMWEVPVWDLVVVIADGKQADCVQFVRLGDGRQIRSFDM